MRPVLFDIGSFAVRSYDVLVLVGMVAGMSLILWRARRIGLSRVRVFAGGVGIILVSLAGSRIGNVLIDLKSYIHNWRAIFSLYGTGFQGGLIGGILATLVFARWLRVSFWRVADLFAPGLVLGQAIGRIGCFLNGCCYGRATDSFLGMYLPGHGVGWEVRYPTQLMHSAANFSILAVLLKADKRKPCEGFVFLLYAILYSTQRLLIDFLRADAVPLVKGIRPTEVVSVATILAAAALLGWQWRRARRVSRAQT